MDSAIVFENSENITPELCNIVEINDQEICDLILKPLSLASLVGLEEGSLLSKSLKAGVEHLENYILGDSSLKDLGFISPIKVLKGTSSGYFLRSSSKVLVDPVTSVGSRVLLTTNHFEESTEHSDVSGALRAVDARIRVSL